MTTATAVPARTSEVKETMVGLLECLVDRVLWLRVGTQTSCDLYAFFSLNFGQKTQKLVDTNSTIATAICIKSKGDPIIAAISEE